MEDSSGSRWKFFSEIVAGLRPKPAYLLIFAICALVFLGGGIAIGTGAKKSDQLYFAFGILVIVQLAAVIVILRVEGARASDDPPPSRERSDAIRNVGPIEDLGNYPAFFPKIIEVINSATKGSGIQIACDYVSYGMFSAGKIADEYRDALIQAKSRGCTIEMLVLGAEPWKQMSAKVPEEHETVFAELMRKEVFRNYLEDFSNRVRKLDLPIPETWKRASHLETLVQVELLSQEMLKAARIKITLVSGPLPLYLWISDSSAVWVVCPLEPRMRFPLLWYDVLTGNRIDLENPLDEHGFISRDHALVQRFRHVWRQYNTLAGPVKVIAKGQQN